MKLECGRYPNVDLQIWNYKPKRYKIKFNMYLLRGKKKCFTFVNALKIGAESPLMTVSTGMNDSLTDMKDRIRQVMESQHMSQQVFAQFIEMSPASLSSIFTGRTRPTLNIVEAIKKKIPDINTDWLMFGSGDMFVRAEGAPSETGMPPAGDLEPALDFGADDFPTPWNDAPASHPVNSVRNARPEIIREEIKYIDKPQRKITEIRIYFDDLTYETFVPSKSR